MNLFQTQSASRYRCFLLKRSNSLCKPLIVKVESVGLFHRRAKRDFFFFQFNFKRGESVLFLNLSQRQHTKTRELKRPSEWPSSK
jgi:hypothetical protein